MRILHYFLGFPPTRSGGLTKYAIDLMQSQMQLGHDIASIHPGNPSLFSQKRDVVHLGIHHSTGISSFRINNALLVPLFHGIKNPKFFMTNSNRDLESFRVFFAKEHFDVIHVHTLMGLPIEFLLVAKENGIKIIYTSHDYFGQCLKVNFIGKNGCICEGPDAIKCANCNKNAKSTFFIWLRNSKILIFLKKLLKR